MRGSNSNLIEPFTKLRQQSTKNNQLHLVSAIENLNTHIYTHMTHARTSLYVYI